MRSVPLAVLTLILVASGCASPPYDVASRPPYPTPNPSTLSQVERTGYAIFLHDQAAWIATEQAFAQGLEGSGATGWITIDQDDSILVRFVGPCGDDACAYMDVATGSPTPIVLRPPPKPLPPDQAGAWHARQRVLNSEFPACSTRYNPVVLPTEHAGEPAWTVYLLAANSRLGEIVLTGHHKYTVAFDGSEIVHSEPLSKTCIQFDAKAKVASLAVTHILHPEPIETHVFTSLNYRLPLLVGTERGTYMVKGTSVRLVSER